MKKYQIAIDDKQYTAQQTQLAKLEDKTDDDYDNRQEVTILAPLFVHFSHVKQDLYCHLSNPISKTNSSYIQYIYI